MIQNWLDSVSDEKIKDYKNYPLGLHGDFFSTSTNLEQKKVALITTKNSFCSKLRSELYKLGDHEHFNQFIDLGTFKKNHVDFISPLLQELIASDIIPIIVGLDFSEYVNFLNISEAKNNHIITNNISKFLGQVNNTYGYFNFMAYQRHLSEKDILENAAVSTKDSCNLGLLKTNIHISEILLRNAESVLFDISVLKKSESPNNPRNNPNGLFTEEACVLAKNAGSGGDLKFINFSGFSEKDCTIEPQICSEFIWYFLEGFLQRTIEQPNNDTNKTMKEIIVESNETSLYYKFFKSNKTGRYWFQMENTNKIIPCSEKEYLEITSSNIPDRILQHIEAD